MQRFDTQPRGCGMGMGMGRGGNGKRFRDGSCADFGQYQAKGRGSALCPNWPRQSNNGRAPNFVDRFLGNGRQAGSPTGSGLDWIKSAIDDLQRQINELRNLSGK